MSKESISAELLQLFQSDQKDRTDASQEGGFQRMASNDSVRLERGREIYNGYKEGKVALSGNDLYNLAMLFQHARDAEDYKIAEELASLSARLGNEHAKWLAAAAEDRHLLRIGEKQKWGTQFKKTENGEYEQAPILSDAESGITDAMRTEHGIPARAEQLAVYLSLVQQEK